MHLVKGNPLAVLMPEGTSSMPIFGSKKEHETKPTQRDLQKAIMILGCLVAMSDGDADQSEITRMKSTAARMPLFANNSIEEDEAVLEDAAKTYDADVLKAVHWATDILQYDNWRAVALCYMCEIVMADGSIDDDEIKILNGMCNDLNLDADEADAIFQTFRVYYQSYGA